MIKAIIFDYDGVIVESTEVKTSAFRKIFENEGEEIADLVVQYHRENQGVSRFDKFRYIYKEILKRELDDRTFLDLCNKFSELVKDDVVNARFVEGAMEFLRAYRKKYLFFIATATPREEIREIMMRNGSLSFFEGVFGAPQTKIDIVQLIKERYKLNADEIVYVGDAAADLEAAKANNVYFIGRVSGTDYDFSGAKCEKLINLNKLEEVMDRIAGSC